ncbi:hypothetical protein NONO_c74180 [Nocardia nova SH22a]|uniref:Uncharacterized protein n=1 Tax=Nocardia nova SH22a TaxID=1415166 RepID=W5TTB5_9NOCA|nr:hypothetical protein [Nocardia nova]AHH22173.1 hypothetical protein NONO_c74180 [Nocardia nova SH22a]
MSVLIANTCLTSDITAHHARPAGAGGWVVSFLPGRRLSDEQALSALLAVEQLASVGECAQALGLTVLEFAGMAADECRWPPPKARPGACLLQRMSRARAGRDG